MENNNNPGGMAPVPSAVMRQRKNNAMMVARPQYANMKVKVVTVRHMHGYETGVGLHGLVVASKEMTLAESQKVLVKVSNRWGRLITKQIPNVGLDVKNNAKDYMDNYDYDAVDRRASVYQHESNVATVKGVIKDVAPSPAPSSVSDGDPW